MTQTPQTRLHKAAHFVMCNFGGVAQGGGSHDHTNDNDNDDTYMTPLGRFDLQSRSAYKVKQEIILLFNN